MLTSPINGYIYSVYHKEGNLLQPGEPFILVGDPKRFRLELLVDERDIAKIKVGQVVFFQTEIHPDQKFEARVSKIVPVLQRETRSFEVEAEVISGEGLYPQSSVEANIVIRENYKTLVIPTDFLQPGDSVLVKHDNQNQKRNIVKGLRNGNWLEVKSGLKEGDIIVRND